MTISRISIQTPYKPAIHAQQSGMRFGSTLDDLRQQFQQEKAINAQKYKDIARKQQDTELKVLCDQEVLDYKYSGYTVADFLFDLEEHGEKSIAEMIEGLPIVTAGRRILLGDSMAQLVKLDYLRVNPNSVINVEHKQKLSLTEAGKEFLKRAYPNRV